jgi:thiol:disulfide interchange protein DsbC
MYRIVLMALLVCTLLPLSPAFGAGEKDANSAQCSPMSKEDAAAVLKDLIPNPKIMEVAKSPLKDLWEVALESSGRKGIVYIDCSRKFLLSGSLVLIAEKRNLTQEKVTEINKVDVSRIPLEDAVLLGDKTAKHKVIVFSDPDCPYCVKLHQEMKKVVAERKDIAFYVKLFPLPMHAGAYDKAKTIVCEKSLALLEDAYEKKEIPKAKCETKAVDATIKLAGELGIAGTPALVFPDGKVVPGAADAKTISGMFPN